jgi:hypothetical protein
VVKPEIFGKCHTSLELTNINLSDAKSVLRKKEFHLGFATEQEIRDLRYKDAASQETISTFKGEARQFVASLLQKLFTRNPIGSVVVRNCNVFNQRVQSFG